MLIKRSEDLKYSDITPRDIYVNRRKFLYGMGLAGGLALAGTTLADLLGRSVHADAPTKLQGMSGSPFSTTEKVTPEKVVTTYNNYYEFGTEKDRARQERSKICHLSLDDFGRRGVRQAAQVHHGRNPEARSAGGAHLPASLRGGLVHRGALDWLLLQHDREACGTQCQREVCGVRKLF